MIIGRNGVRGPWISGHTGDGASPFMLFIHPRNYAARVEEARMKVAKGVSWKATGQRGKTEEAAAERRKKRKGGTESRDLFLRSRTRRRLLVPLLFVFRSKLRRCVRAKLASSAADALLNRFSSFRTIRADEWRDEWKITKNGEYSAKTQAGWTKLAVDGHWNRRRKPPTFERLTNRGWSFCKLPATSPFVSRFFQIRCYFLTFRVLQLQSSYIVWE